MLRGLKELERYTVSATDGDVGSVVNFLFDDERWAIRYLVVSTGGFFLERRVLISPISFREVDWQTQVFHLALSRDRIKNSPRVDTDLPVSRQHERDYYRYYSYPYYWGYMGVWGAGYYPALLGPQRSSTEVPEVRDQDSGDAHLRSAMEVRGYDIQGSDDAIGFVSDFIIDDETWEVRYLVVDTSHWWWGHQVLVAPSWAREVSWTQRKVLVSLSRDAMQKSPSWDPSAPIRREYEARLHAHYGLGGYWASAATSSAGSSGIRTKKSSAALRRLIRACIDNERTLLHERKFVDGVRAEALTRLTHEREQFVVELERLGGRASPRAAGSWAALAREAAGDLWTAAAGRSTSDAIANCRHSRARTEAEYDEAMRMVWPGEMLRVLTDQRRRLHDEASELDQLQF